MQATALLIFAFIFLLLPLIPALRELYRPQDASPLEVSQGNPSDSFEPLQKIEEARKLGADVAQLQREHGFWEVPANARSWREAPSGVQVIQARTATHLRESPPENSRVVKAPALRVGGDVQTAVALCAETAILLKSRCEVRSVQAPTIWAELLDPAGFNEELDAKLPVAQELPGATWDGIRRCWHAKGPLEIKAGVKVEGAIIAASKVTVGAGSFIEGSVKSASHVKLGQGAVVGENLVAKSANLGRSSVVKGCCVCDDGVVLEAGSRVGSLDSLATVLATTAELFPGARVHGAIVTHQSITVPMAGPMPERPLTEEVAAIAV